MKPAAVSSNNLQKLPTEPGSATLSVAAIVAPCSARKTVDGGSVSHAVSLPQGLQSDLETTWRHRVADLPMSMSAKSLYRGRGFAMARRASERSGARLFIVSAGLGLVDADRVVPAYGMTVALNHGDHAIRNRVIGRFDPASWWRALSGGPYASSLAEAFQGTGLVVMALSHTYADLLAENLASLSDERLLRLRVVGAGLGQRLPERVRSAALLPYDDRLDGLVPGVRGDFCQRALGHFVDVLEANNAGSAVQNDIAAHRGLVDASLGRRSLPPPPRRIRVTDAVIAERIAARLPTSAHAPRAAVLRALRDEDGIACEAARFSRLYRLAAQGALEGTAQ